MIPDVLILIMLKSWSKPSILGKRADLQGNSDERRGISGLVRFGAAQCAQAVHALR